MTSESSNRSDHETVLEQVLADYLHSVEADNPLDQQELLRKHPDLADQLRSFFANRAEIERLAQPLKGSGYDPTMGLAESRATADPARVRYLGDYELLEEIARGGMGVVYKARQVNLDRVVALKMILSGQLASEDDVRRFYQRGRVGGEFGTSRHRADLRNWPARRTAFLFNGLCRRPKPCPSASSESRSQSTSKFIVTTTKAFCGLMTAVSCFPATNGKSN